MRSDIINYLRSNRDYFYFLREHPEWYRTLTRNPEQLSQFLTTYKTVRRKRFIDRVDDFGMMARIIANMPPAS